MKKSSIEIAAGGSSSDNDSPSSQSDEAIPAAVPAAIDATPVERGRFVLDVHNRDEDSVSAENEHINDADNDDKNDNSNAADDAPDSPKSFNSDDIFEDVEQGEEQISDHDLERLLGPLPLKRTGKNMLGENNSIPHSVLEMDGNDDDTSDESRRKRPKKGVCPCCPSVVRRGPWQMLAAMIGWDGSVPSTPVGNMIVVFPSCYYNRGFGIMGPHWFGPICCLALLTIATSYFAPKAYHNIGPISGITCLLFYIVGIASLCVVSCSDPGVVKSDLRGGKNGYGGVPATDVSAGRGWRYCDLCSVYQPPDAVHCPECNVCIQGYDHHCPWMGTCIGEKNFTSFMAFNMTWLFYFLYSIIWVMIVGTSLAQGPVNSSDDV